MNYFRFLLFPLVLAQGAFGAAFDTFIYVSKSDDSGGEFKIIADPGFDAAMGWDEGTNVPVYYSLTAQGQAVVAATSYAAMRELLDLEAGTDFVAVGGDGSGFTALTAANMPQVIETITAATTIAASDHRNLYFLNSASGVTQQLPAGITDGTTVTVWNIGAGDWTFEDASVTLKDLSGSTLANYVVRQYDSVTFIEQGTDTWYVWSQGIRHNLSAGSNPGVTNDLDEGYGTGSIWVNTDTPAIYMAVTVADGAADWNQIDGAGSGTGADADGTYIVQTATAAPTNAQVLADLATGLVKNTTTTGVLSIGADGTDYISSVVVDTTPELGGALDGGAFDITNLNSMILNEQSSESDPGAGKGRFWVESTTPTTARFTDDTGNKFGLLNSTASNPGQDRLVIRASGSYFTTTSSATVGTTGTAAGLTINNSTNTVQTNTATYSTAQTLTAAQCYGSVIYITGEMDVQLPAVVAGMSVTIIADAAEVVSIAPDAGGTADTLRLDGTDQTAGHEVDSTGTLGDIAVLTYHSADKWYVSSNTWVAGGAAD